MPLYEYQCETCGAVFEKMQRFSDEPLTVHEGCGGPVHRLLSAPALQFKGTGWYVTDYARGKSGSNDANAEYLGEIRRMLEKHDVHFQLAELGRVDLGGGGTIAYIMSLYGMQVIDSGVGVLSMHAPWEATSKVDIYETKKGYMAFLAEA